MRMSFVPRDETCIGFHCSKRHSFAGGLLIRPEEDGPRFVPLQGIPAAKGCSRPLANEMRQQILLWPQGLQVAILLLADLHASLDPMPKMLQPRLDLDSIKLGPAQL